MAKNKRQIDMKYIVLFSLLGFFGLIFIANGFLVYFAQSSWNGLQYEDAYERGIAYNKTLEKRAEEDKLGWKVTSHFEQTPPSPEAAPQGFAGTLFYQLTAADDTALAGATLTLTLSRPIEGGEAQSFTLSVGENGQARQAITLPKPGQWDVETVITLKDASLTSRQRIYVKE